MVLRTLVSLILAAAAVGAQTPPRTKADAESPLVDRVADTGFIQLRADSFSQLTPPQQALAYWLTQASIAIDPIIYDQLSRFGIREKRLLEGILGHSAGVAPEPLANLHPF